MTNKPYICPMCGKEMAVDDFCSKKCLKEFVAEEAKWAKSLHNLNLADHQR